MTTRTSKSGRRPTLPVIQRRELLRVAAELERAQRLVRRRIREAPGSAGWAHWERVAAAIADALARFERAAAAATGEGIERALNAGLRATADALGTGLHQLDSRALLGLRASAVERIKDVSVQAQQRIRAILSQQMIGFLRRDQAVALIDRILGGNVRRRALTIVNTEVGRAYSIASYEAAMAASARGVKMVLMWRKSGKLHPRSGHVAAHGQMVRPGQSFHVFNASSGTTEALRFPRDPRGSAGNTINCGCLAVPLVDGSRVERIDPRTGEVTQRILKIPDDPNAPLQYLSAEEAAADAQARIERARAALAAVGAEDAAGLRVTSDAGGGGGGILPPILPPGGGGGLPPDRHDLVLYQMLNALAARSDAIDADVTGRRRLRLLWRDMDSYSRHVRRRINDGSVIDADDLATQVFGALAAAEVVELAVAARPEHTIGQFAAAVGKWLVLLDLTGTIATAFPRDPEKPDFATWNAQYEHSIRTIDLSPAHRALLARLFGVD